MGKHDFEREIVVVPAPEPVLLDEAILERVHDAIDFARSQQPSIDDALDFAKRQILTTSTNS